MRQCRIHARHALPLEEFELRSDDVSALLTKDMREMRGVPDHHILILYGLAVRLPRVEDIGFVWQSNGNHSIVNFVPMIF